MKRENPSPFHAGEMEIQRRLGVEERVGAFAQRAIRDHMPEQHRTFFAQLPFLVAGAVDPDGDPWVTLLTGAPGFAHAPSAQTLDLDISANPNDPAWRGLQETDSVGLLGIELETRRRNRLNGILHPRPNGLRVHVVHSFGNCPQYIQRRRMRWVDRDEEPEGPRTWSTQLTERARQMISTADTMFVSSYVDLPERGRQVDVSHRGGKAGFVRVGDDGTLTIPDYAGNLLFNTLGNLLTNPRAGLGFIDFSTGDMLQLTGTTEVVFESPEIAAFEGAERLWRFSPTNLVYREGALAMRWAFVDWSPNSLMTGSWEQTTSRIEAANDPLSWRPYTITQIVEESDEIRSLHLHPADGAGVPRHDAGQHLPVRVQLPDTPDPHLRTYTLSVAPSDPGLRISVKRDGLVSQHIHDTLRVGDCIEARAPAGEFTIDAKRERPVVLIGAGVGITPMLAMLRHLIFEGRRTRSIRPTVLIHAARSARVRAFDAELLALLELGQGKVRLIRILSAPEPGDLRPGDLRGRVDRALLQSLDLGAGADWYLCGPPAFMQASHDALRALHVPDEQIHAESFGPASILRQNPTQSKASRASVPITFTPSGQEALWKPEGPTLLVLAETLGLSPNFGCRSGSCGACAARLRAGQVTYRVAPSYTPLLGEVLLCCAVPAQDTEPIEVEI